MDFPRWLLEEKERRGFPTVRAFAEYLDVHEAQLGRYMKGYGEPGLTTFGRIIDKLGFAILPKQKGTDRPATEDEVRGAIASKWPDLTAHDVDDVIGFIHYRRHSGHQKSGQAAG